MEMAAQHELAHATLSAAEHAVRADCADQVITTEDIANPVDSTLVALSQARASHSHW